MTAMTDPVSLPRVAKGKRPHFFDDKAIDHLMTMVLELSTELYTVYARLDTLERTLAARAVIEPGEVDAFKIDDAADAERLQWRELLLSRLFRTISADQG